MKKITRYFVLMNICFAFVSAEFIWRLPILEYPQNLIYKYSTIVRRQMNLADTMTHL
jgi:hypothetical protein